MTPRLEHFASLDSTSLHARRALDSGTAAPGTGPIVYTADEQTAGIGRFGRTWTSPRGGLWMTLVHPIEPRARGLDTLGLRVGAACLASVISAMAGSPRAAAVRLKWPNDVLIAGRKVLGVLCETVNAAAHGTWVLIGVGVNANLPAAALPGHFRRPPTTLLDELGHPTDLAALRDDLCERLIAAVTVADPGPALALARGRLYGLGEPASLRTPDGAETRGTLAGLSDAGLPLLRTPAGTIASPPGAELHVESGAAAPV